MFQQIYSYLGFTKEQIEKRETNFKENWTKINLSSPSETIYSDVNSEKFVVKKVVKNKRRPRNIGRRKENGLKNFENVTEKKKFKIQNVDNSNTRRVVLTERVENKKVIKLDHFVEGKENLNKFGSVKTIAKPFNDSLQIQHLKFYNATTQKHVNNYKTLNRLKPNVKPVVRVRSKSFKIQKDV